VASALPSASRMFIILAVAEGELSRGSTSCMGRLFLQHSGERALTGLAEGANFDNAGPVGRKRRQLQRAWLAGSAGSAGSGTTSDAASCRLVRAWPSVHRTGDRRAVRTGISYKTSYAARAAFVFLDCLVLTPARHLRVEAGAGPSART
jgi:hypothetical protein